MASALLHKILHRNFTFPPSIPKNLSLSGMGPISPLSTTSAKLFASLYALFSGLIFVLAMGTVLSPLVYSLLSQFQVNLKTENYNDAHQQN
ncbi:MAG: hypothetical protein AB4372_25595 [Xenococcus sp. (in: cyanobacteria)]